MDITIPAGFEPVAVEQLTISTAVVPLTAATYLIASSQWDPGDKKASKAIIAVEDQGVRWTIYPGATVDANTNGLAAAAGDIIYLNNTAAIVNFRAIRTGGSDGQLNVIYGR